MTVNKALKHDPANVDETRETPRLVLCDLGEMDWLKVDDNFILVNHRYAAKIKRNREG